MEWFRLSLAPAIVALLGGPPAPRLWVSEPNDGHFAFLPDDAIVEKPCAVDTSGPRPRHRAPESFADEIASLLRGIVRFETLAERAAREPDADTVAAALNTHPWDIPPDARAALTEHLLRASTSPGTGS